MTTASGLVFEVVLAFVETGRPFLDSSEPSDACTITEIDLMKDFGIGKVLCPEKMDDEANIKRQNKCRTDIKSRLIRRQSQIGVLVPLKWCGVFDMLRSGIFKIHEAKEGLWKTDERTFSFRTRRILDRHFPPKSDSWFESE
jgi:hypothetical protein